MVELPERKRSGRGGEVKKEDGGRVEGDRKEQEEKSERQGRLIQVFKKEPVGRIPNHPGC